ncbi:MAG: T9SS type A sorting domain-containing protein, partial [Bacteroidota bacterium]
GTTYTQSGTYNRTLTNVAGCDSTATLILTIKQATSGSSTVSACSSYTWQGTTYTQSGTYNRTLTNVAGCDSTATLILTIQTPATPTIQIVASVSGAVSAGTSVTFTASTTFGGSLPSYQWKKNSINVGTNSSAYTNAQWVNGDIVTCVLTSNATCVTNSVVVSNAITIQVLSQGSNARFLVVDVTQNRACYYDSTFNFITSNVLSTNVLYANTNVSDVIATSTMAYILDGVNMCVYRSTASNTVATRSRTLLTNTGAKLSGPTGLTLSGDTLWLLDPKNKFVYRYSLSSAFAGTGSVNALARITLSNSNTKGEALWNDAGSLYVLDNGSTNKIIFRYNKSGGTPVSSRTLRSNTGGTLGTVTGMTVRNGIVHVTDRTQDKVYPFSLQSLYTGTGTLNAISVYSLNSNNLDATGITVVSGTSLLRTSEEPAISEKAKDKPMLYPNPALDDVSIKYYSEQVGVAYAEIFDLNGKSIFKTEQQIYSEGVNELWIRIGSASIPSGVYFVRLYCSERVEDFRLIIAR